MFKQVLILLAVAAVLWELKALYSLWTAYTRSRLDEIHNLPITERPNRLGHFVGNIVRLFHHRWWR